MINKIFRKNTRIHSRTHIVDFYRTVEHTTKKIHGNCEENNICSFTRGAHASLFLFSKFHFKKSNSFSFKIFFSFAFAKLSPHPLRWVFLIFIKKTNKQTNTSIPINSWSIKAPSSTRWFCSTQQCDVYLFQCVHSSHMCMCVYAVFIF